MMTAELLDTINMFLTMPPRELVLHAEQRSVRSGDDPIARELYSHCLRDGDPTG